RTGNPDLEDRRAARGAHHRARWSRAAVHPELEADDLALRRRARRGGLHARGPGALDPRLEHHPPRAAPLDRLRIRIIATPGAGAAAMTNYQPIRDLGRKIQTYFRDRHITEKVSRTKDYDPVPNDSRGPGAPDAGGDHPKKKKLKKAAKTSRKKD